MDTSLFTYKDFTLSEDRKLVECHYETIKEQDTFTFTETYRFPVALPDTQETYRLLRALHLIGGISYYKIFVNADIEHPYAMSTREAGFWNTVFTNGLGEFLYVNKLDPARIATFGPQEGHDTKTTARTQLEPKALLGIGGGKDSIVAGEILKSAGVPLAGFVLATGTAIGQTEYVARTMKVNLHTVQRVLDKQLLEVQERPDAFKGHIPISVFFALIGSLLAVASKSAYVVVANESSASIPRSHWEGMSVNHQWSKSFEFELLMQSYLHDFVSADLHYFSVIRPLSSVAVAKLFSRYTDYFSIFTSDNYAFRITESERPNERWSMQSPKSLSSFILLSAWLTEQELLTIFGRNFYDEPQLEDMFLRLTGLKDEAPLDCVGTPEELRASIGRAYERYIFGNSILILTANHYGVVADDRLMAPTAASFLKLGTEKSFPPELDNILTSKITEGML